jgi:hypothetical protein
MSTTPYVKFFRGTPTAFENLLTKNEDTLYFISEKDSKECKLYLGEQLIAGGSTSGGEGSGITTLAELKDVLLSNLKADSFLVYKDGKWVNKYLEDLVMIGA